VILALIALASAHAAEPLSPTKQQLRTITAECKVPARWLHLHEDGSVHFQPPANSRYVDVDCVLTKLKPYKVMAIGFIGK
jgi:hypothetical protein